MVAPLLGLSPDQAIALLLCKRLRDLLFGVPALLSWPLLERSRRSAGKT